MRFPLKPHILVIEPAGGSLTYKSMLTHLHKTARPHGDPTGTRTPISTLKGWCPRPVRRWDHILHPPGHQDQGLLPIRQIESEW